MNHKARQEFCKDLDLNPNSPFVKSLIRACITHHKYCECECNGCTREKYSIESWADYDKAREYQMQWLEKRIEKIEKTILKNAKILGLNVLFNGDPRGPTIRLSRKPIAKNDPFSARAADVWNWQ